VVGVLLSQARDDVCNHTHNDRGAH
jgi:hypothetical protein